ncbi:SemiSWEET transporter [Geodermatophilus sp. URMC 64]
MIAALGFLAAALSITVVWPQVWLSCRHGRTLGLSPTSTWLAVGLNLCWLTFGVLIGDPAQIVTNAVVGAGNAAVLAALLNAQPRLRSSAMLRGTASGAAGLATLAAGSLVAVDVLGADPAAVAGTLGSVVTLVGAAAALPQLLGILFDRTRDLSGMSPARWYLGAGSCTSWVGYGVLVDQPAMWLSAGFSLCCAVVTCGVLRARRTAPAGPLVALRPAVAVRTGRLPRAFACPADARAVLAAAV